MGSILAVAVGLCAVAMLFSPADSQAQSSVAAGSHAHSSCRGSSGNSLSHWQPKPTTEPWQWQFRGVIDTDIDACVYDLDGFETPKRIVAALHRRHVKTICEVDVGVWEKQRPDAAEFPRSAIGRDYRGSADKRWLDVSHFRSFEEPLRRRFQMCARKGFDAIAPDDVDGWERRSETGFPITREDQIRFDRWVAFEVHVRGMAVGLKNDGRQARRLYNNFDFAVVERCFERDECSRFADTFVRHHKAVYDAELGGRRRRYCPIARALDISAIRKSAELFSLPWRGCEPGNRSSD